jgi:hypothetical protein
MPQGDSGLQEGDLVCFTVESVYLPTPDRVLAELTTAERLVGRITQFSSSGDKQNAYAVVTLPSHSKLVVPSDRLERVSCASHDL